MKMRGIKKTAIGFGRILVILIAVLSVIYGGLAIFLYGSYGRLPVSSEAKGPQKISNLVWPTLGFPSLSTAGSVLEVEFMLPPGGVEEEGASQQAPDDWRAELLPSNQALAGLSYTFAAAGAHQGESNKWPGGTLYGGDARLWHVQFDLSEDIHPELYDLEVTATVNGETVSGRQPHAVSINPDDPDEYTFMTISDVHVHRYGLDGVGLRQTNKGITYEGRPLFLERAIDQINLVRPDFLVFLGDGITAQGGHGDYLPEFANFYHGLMQLQVPIFMIPGNHDLYINDVDGRKVWEQNIGPLFYSFDLGPVHYTFVNSYEWPNSDRMLMEKFKVLKYPRKWQGQFMGAVNGKDPNDYTGQLGWIRDDLAASQDSSERLLFMHADPYSPDGDADSWKNRRFYGIFTMGGGGKGAAAFRLLAARFKVNTVFSGHLHEDHIGTDPWENGEGETTYSNQTCTYFDHGGKAPYYPGYRLVRVKAGKARLLTYKNTEYSIPFYDGSVPRGTTDIDKLKVPAITTTPTFSTAEDSEKVQVGVSVMNYLDMDLTLKGLLYRVEDLDAGYTLNRGTVYREVRIPGTQAGLLYISLDIGRGDPSEEPPIAGTPNTVKIRIKEG